MVTFKEGQKLLMFWNTALEGQLKLKYRVDIVISRNDMIFEENEVSEKVKRLNKYVFICVLLVTFWDIVTQPLLKSSLQYCQLEYTLDFF